MDLNEAIADIDVEARCGSKSKMSADGIGAYEILLDRKDIYVPAGYSAKDTLLLKSVLEFVAVGRPKWQ